MKRHFPFKKNNFNHFLLRIMLCMTRKIYQNLSLFYFEDCNLLRQINFNVIVCAVICKIQFKKKLNFLNRRIKIKKYSYRSCYALPINKH